MLAIFYSIVYFLGLPLILLFFYLKFKSQTEFINFFNSLSSRGSKENQGIKENIEKKRSRLRKAFVVILLVFFTSWHLVTSELVDISMKREMKYGSGGMYSENPVAVSLGPTYDTKKLIETVRDDRERWLPDKVEKLVDLDYLASFKGRVAAYRTYDQRYIIVCTYLLPYPLIRSFGFKYVKTDKGQLKIINKDKKMVFYPFGPGQVDDTAKLMN